MPKRLPKEILKMVKEKNLFRIYEIVKTVREFSGYHKFKVGAVVSNYDLSYMCIGYNGLPSRLPSSDKYDSTFAIHAEYNALSKFNFMMVDKAILAVTFFPCFQCAKNICHNKKINILVVESYTGFKGDERFDRYGCNLAYDLFCKCGVKIFDISKKEFIN